MYANPSGIREAAKQIDEAVQVLPRLAGEAVAPNPGMYGKILTYSAQMTEPATTDARKHLFEGMEFAGTSIVTGLMDTADNYEQAEQEAVERVSALNRVIAEKVV